jgi:hypothetical protein
MLIAISLCYIFRTTLSNCGFAAEDGGASNPCAPGKKGPSIFIDNTIYREGLGTRR